MSCTNPKYIVQMKTGHPHIRIPTHQSLSQDMIKAFEGGQRKLRQKLSVSMMQTVCVKRRANVPLQKVKSAVSVSLDMWTSPVHIPMCGIVIHYEDKGQHKSHILDVFEAREVCEQSLT